MPKHHPIKTPPLHALIIYGTLGLIVFFGLLYVFAPEGRQGVFETAITGLLAFLFGKLSNSFGKPLIPKEGEGEEEEEL